MERARSTSPALYMYTWMAVRSELAPSLMPGHNCIHAPCQRYGQLGARVQALSGRILLLVLNDALVVPSQTDVTFVDGVHKPGHTLDVCGVFSPA